MTKAFATEYTSQVTIDFRALSYAQAGDWESLIEAKHTLWGRMTSVWGGHAFDPVWQTTTSGSYVTASDTDARPLDTVRADGLTDKTLEGDIIRIGVAAYVEDCEMQITLYNRDAGAQLTQYTQSASGPAWVLSSFEAGIANVTDANGDAQLIETRLEAQTNATTASIWKVYAGELETDDVTDLPDGL